MNKKVLLLSVNAIILGSPLISASCNITKTEQKQVLSKDGTELIQIGFKNGQIEAVPKTVKKVPTTLPKQITSLKDAFKENVNDKIEGIEKW
ncbi:Uncharacterised protein, partial [Metamycoplasma alkalescens]